MVTADFGEAAGVHVVTPDSDLLRDLRASVAAQKKVTESSPVSGVAFVAGVPSDYFNAQVNCEAIPLATVHQYLLCLDSFWFSWFLAVVFMYSGFTLVNSALHGVMSQTFNHAFTLEG